MSKLTRKQVQEIITAYPNVKAQELADKYGVKVNKIYATAKRYKVKKSPEFMASDKSGRMKPGQCISPETQIKPGQKLRLGVDNKIKQPHPTAWRKGHKGPRTANDGDIRYRVDGWRIRISENEWVFYTRWLWEKHNGAIPEGYNIVFKTKANEHIPPVITDLECISNAELGERNRITKYPTEVRELIILRNKLTREIKNYEQ